MTSKDELLQIADRLSAQAEAGDAPEITDPIQKLGNAVDDMHKCFSGSWLGYHAFVYYSGLTPPPPGAHFSQEWGLMDTWGSHGSTGEWREYGSEEITTAIYEAAENPSLDAARDLAKKSDPIFDDAKSEVLSILSSELAVANDGFLETIKTEVEALKNHTRTEIINNLSPGGQKMTRDSTAVGQGTKAPPHMRIKAELIELHNATALLSELSKLARKAGSHLGRKNKQQKKSEMIGTNVFIGHGRSPAWKDLKDFISDRLSLPYDEFNRVPVAGVTNIARLSEMLEAAAIAFIILTGEDELADGNLHARLNAVHEAGLFQGRIGFTKAIILLEEGCAEFSNINGLGQIRFPKGNIAAAFEEIRRVLEREGIIQ